MFDRTILDNGLRVITSTMPHTRSVSVGFFIGAGSRYESDELAGVSHFLEHMLFKGTQRRPTARVIAEEIEGIGGVMNAATDKELTVFWAKVGHQHFARCLDVLADALLHSILDADEIEKERQVILDELAMSEDSPADLAGLLIDEVLWPDQPLGRDVGGSKRSVSALSRDQISEYILRQYVPENTVLAVAGNVSHETVIELAKRHLGGWPRGPFGSWYPATNGQAAARVGLKSKRTEQTHLCLAVQGYSSSHPDRFALDVLNAILGEGMSSRLFLEVRERLALAYDVHSYVSHFRDAGCAVIGAGVDPKKVEPTIRTILRELQLLQEGVPEPELIKAKEFIKGRIQLRMEDTRAVSSWLGSQELLRNEVLTVDEVVEAIERITSDDLRRVAQKLFRPELLNLAVVGPYKSEDRFARLLRL
ncbi:MAG TPA: pitrilysin family protein [Chloroflexota bacterium]|nr:pitrilysin family protein [Chloroflexota bacterium]